MTLLSIKQVAELLGMHQMSIYKMVWEGKLPAVKLGRLWRIRLQDVEKLVTKEE